MRKRDRLGRYYWVRVQSTGEGGARSSRALALTQPLHHSLTPFDQLSVDGRTLTMAERDQMKLHIAEILKGAELEEFSAKKVREQVEQRMGLETGALKSEKATISALIDEVLQENPPKDESGAEEEDAEEEEEEEKKPAKGKKRPAAAAPEEGKQPKSTCRTASGDEAPKNVKKLQESMKMTAAKFLRDGPTLKIDLCGNELQGPPRTFSSGNKGRVVPPPRPSPRGAARR